MGRTYAQYPGRDKQTPHHPRPCHDPEVRQRNRLHYRPHQNESLLVVLHNKLLLKVKALLEVLMQLGRWDGYTPKYRHCDQLRRPLHLLSSNYLEEALANLGLHNNQITPAPKNYQ